MLLSEWLDKHINLEFLKEDFRKIGVNFVSAGIVGIFINHYIGSELSSMFSASASISILGFITLYFGVQRRNKK